MMMMMITGLGFAVIKYVQYNAYPSSGTICYPEKTQSKRDRGFCAAGLHVLSQSIPGTKKKPNIILAFVHSNARVT